MTSRGPLLIVGASGRAAAASALRTGYQPIVIDLFADEDTKRLCPVLKCPFDQYPHGFIELAKQAPPGPWMYTGGLENDPDVVAAISEARPLIGNGPEVLRRVRDPFALAEVCRDNGIAFPETRAESASLDYSRRWLRKSRRSSGGLGVCRFEPGEPIAAHDYLQEQLDGVPTSAQFEGPVLFGITRQLIAEPWLHAKPFGYCGNISQPFELYPRPVKRIGERLAEAFGLQRRWGIDYLDCDGEPILLEINPRYTAAVEVVEFAGQSEPVVGKAIYFAPDNLTFPADGPWSSSRERSNDIWQRPDFADIPAAGSTIDCGQPVLTIFVGGETESDVERRLKERAAEMDRIFGFTR